MSNSFACACSQIPSIRQISHHNRHHHHNNKAKHSQLTTKKSARDSELMSTGFWIVACSSGVAVAFASAFSLRSSIGPPDAPDVTLRDKQMSGRDILKLHVSEGDRLGWLWLLREING